METALVETELTTLGDYPDIERMAELRAKIDFLKEFTKRIAGRWDDMMLAIVQDKGDQVIGEIRYYAGVEKKTKCPDKAKGLETILECAGGDFGAVAEMLASDPFKPGACKELLGERWGEVFEVTEKAELKEGKPSKKLMAINPKFIR